MIIEKLNNGNVEISIKGIPKAYTGFYVIHQLVDSVGIYDGRILLSEIRYTEIKVVINKGETLSLPTSNVLLYELLRDVIFEKDKTSSELLVDSLAQTALLEFIRTSIELNEQILVELKINNKHLSIITGDELFESDVDN